RAGVAARPASPPSHPATNGTAAATASHHAPAAGRLPLRLRARRIANIPSRSRSTRNLTRTAPTLHPPAARRADRPPAAPSPLHAADRTRPARAAPSCPRPRRRHLVCYRPVIIPTPSGSPHVHEKTLAQPAPPMQIPALPIPWGRGRPAPLRGLPPPTVRTRSPSDIPGEGLDAPRAPRRVAAPCQVAHPLRREDHDASHHSQYRAGGCAPCPPGGRLHGHPRPGGTRSAAPRGPRDRGVAVRGRRARGARVRRVLPGRERHADRVPDRHGSACAPGARARARAAPARAHRRAAPGP